MGSSFRWYLSGATLFQLGAELAWLLIAGILAVSLHAGSSSTNFLGPALLLAIILVSMNGAFGLYRHDSQLRLQTYAGRLALAMLVTAPVAYALAEFVPAGELFQQNFLQVLVLSFCGLILVRQVLVSPAIRALAPHRVLVLGTGNEAATVQESFAHLDRPGVQLVGFYPLPKLERDAVARDRVLDGSRPLEALVRESGISEVIVAVREQRGGVLPLRSLLECRLLGVRVTDMARHFESIEGRIRIESLKASWLIYGNGFRQGWWRSLVKRSFDVLAASVLLVLTLPLLLCVAILIAMDGKGPVIYRQERVGLRGARFTLLKFRSMHADAEKDGKAAWASVGDRRITPLGRWMRRTRIDELPQLINVLKGEMSFVGPRPERPVFVAMLTEKVPFYAVRHSVKPGLTGWAQVRYSYGATIEESVTKLEYDLYYVKNHALFLDLVILFETVRVVLLGEGAR